MLACSDMEPRREWLSGLDAPEIAAPSRTSSLGMAASYMSSLMLILVSVKEGRWFLGVLAGTGMERAWRSFEDMDMDAASREESSCSGKGASVPKESGDGGAVDSSGDSASADSNSGSTK